MKKNLITFKNKTLYYYHFLPIVEVILTVKKHKKQDLVLNKTILGEYFGVDRRDIATFLKQAEQDGLIKFDRNVRKFDDKTIEFAVSRYEFPLANDESKYYSRMQEFINDYMLWTPDYGDRLDFYYNFLDSVEKNQVTKSIKQLQKEEKAKAYEAESPWIAKTMEKINATRPEKLRSKYLSDGKLRESNYLCATLNPEKDHEAKLFANDLLYRYILLEDFFGTKDFIECDTNASIYRLSYNLAHNKLLADDVDIYQKFWQIAGFNGGLDRIARDSLKLLCMIIFMSNGAKNGYNSMLVLKDDKDLTRSELERKDILNYMTKRTGLTARQFLDRLAEAMYQFLEVDEFLEEEIFIHESNLHLLILEMCEQEGIQAINVYDGFYFKKTDMNNAKYNCFYREATLRLKELEKKQ